MRRNDRGLWIALGVLVLVLLAGPALGGGMMGGYGPGGMMGGWYRTAALGGNGRLWGLSIGLGGLMMLAFWGALIALAVLLFRRVGGSTGGPSPTEAEAPMDVLKRRFAAGEITPEQYEEMRHALAG